MAQATLRISSDKDFFSCETPDAEWEPEQISDNGLNLLCEDEDPEPAYLIITSDFEGALPKNRVYQLVPLDTVVIEGVDFEQANDEEEEETTG